MKINRQLPKKIIIDVTQHLKGLLQ